MVLRLVPMARHHKITVVLPYMYMCIAANTLSQNKTIHDNTHNHLSVSVDIGKDPGSLKISNSPS